MIQALICAVLTVANVVLFVWSGSVWSAVAAGFCAALTFVNVAISYSEAKR